MMTTRLFLPACLLALLAGCASDDGSNAPSPPEEIADPTAPDRAGRDPQAPEEYQVRLETTQGDVVIKVDRSWSPRGADRFYRLVKEGYYNEAKFFRVLPDFMAQVGMAADPKVNAKWQEARIPDDPVRESNTRGRVSFATSGPDSRTSQFFINYGDNSDSLDPQGFSPFGEVTEGMENVEKLYSEYGEGAPNGTGPSQSIIAAEGNAYLEREFPKLDAIKKATVIGEDKEPIAADEKKSGDDAAGAEETSEEQSGAEK